MGETVDRRIVLRSVANFRDLGGLPIADGVFTPNQVFRSASLSRFEDDEQPTFASLGIHTVYDLRTQTERTDQPGRLPAAVRAVALDVLADGTAGVAHAIGRIRNEPELVNGLLQGGKIGEMLKQSYREFIDLPSAQQAYRSFFLDLADENRSGAALFHCTAGKDRTGWAAASLLMLLGADDDTILADYLQTNTDYLPTMAPLIKSASERGVDPELLYEAFSVHEEYLDTAREQLQQSYSTVENYFASGLGLTSDTIEALRTRFTA